MQQAVYTIVVDEPSMPSVGVHRRYVSQCVHSYVCTVKKLKFLLRAQQLNRATVASTVITIIIIR